MSTMAATAGDWQPRPLRRLMQVNVCILICVSGVTFAAAEGSPLGLLSVPIAIVGLVLTDRRRQFALTPRWTDLLGLAAFVAAAFEFFSESVEGQLLSLGHLLLYLAWILMLRPKESAQIWWLCLLSILHIATASVLTNDYWFPLAAMGYMLLAMWTMSVFSLDRTVAQSAAIGQPAPIANGNNSPRAIQGQADRSAGGSDGRAGSQSRNTMRFDSVSRWITPRFAMGIVACWILSILLGLAIFLLTPRIWIGRLRVFEETIAGRVQPLTGFTEEVTLGDIGEILENPHLVLEVEFFEGETNQQVDVETIMSRLGYDTPVFRGRVLERYTDGRWSKSSLSAREESPRRPDEEGLLRQEIHLYPIGTETLFAADRALTCVAGRRTDIEHDELRDTFTVIRRGRRDRRERDQPGILSYSAYSRVPGSQRQQKRGSGYWNRRGVYETETLKMPSGLDRLKRLAQTLAQPRDETSLSELEVARRMLAHLRDSGDYLYTLNVSLEDPTIDPVEDFLFHRKQGHCEYFASALALMLRAEEIPSRLISGFKGGTLNSQTGSYEVRQLHAHAWVEALIDEQWVVFDPTPASRDASVARMRTTISPWRLFRDRLEQLWLRGLFMNQVQQRVEIYMPLADFFRGSFETARGMSVFQMILQWFRELGNNPRNWFSGPGFITAFVLGVILSGFVWLLRKLWRWFRQSSLSHRGQRDQQRRMIEFYERFRRLVARLGHVRRDSSTHREFAGTIEQRWRERADIDGFADLPTRLADAFYRVRFGDQPLPDDELQDINTSLDRLEQWIADERRMSA